MRNIYLYTENFRLFYLLTRRLREEHFPFIPLDNFLEIPPHEGILVTTQADLDKYHAEIPARVQKLVVDPHHSLEITYLRMLQALRGIHSFKSLTIALDPGMEITGVALLLDKKYVQSEQFPTRTALLCAIKEYLTCFPVKNRIIKIGNGMPRLTRSLLHSFFSENFDRTGIDFYIVNEEQSSQHQFTDPFQELDKHQQAAIAIGLRSGLEVNDQNLEQYLRVKHTKAVIKGIQKDTRMLAHNRNRKIAISKEDAKAIHSGEKNITDFIRPECAEEENEKNSNPGE